jgi:hypothetical protein
MNNPHWVGATGFWLHHAMFANGLHTLQLRTLLRLNNLVGPGEQYLTITNPSVRVLTTNAITFPDWNPEVGGTWRFRAKSTEPRVNWRIDIRDFKDRLLISKTGSTTNGDISWLWDLRDSQGKPYDDLPPGPSFSPGVTTWPLDQKPSESTLQQKAVKSQASQSWWLERLGADFIRMSATSKRERAKPPPAEYNPLERQVKPRPLDLNK